MRTLAQKTAFQIALTNCPKEVGEKVSINVILGKEEYMKSSIYIYIYIFFFFAEGFCSSHEGYY